MADLTERQFGNYRLIRLLGQGGFADVYLGVHIHLNTQAAIKILRPRLVGSTLEDFRKEAQVIARLIHPYIVRVLEFDVEEGIAFLVMDYAPNGSLRQRHPKNIPVPPAIVVSYVKQVAAALQYAHYNKLIHRDVKPENMLVGWNNDILLSDFGLVLPALSSGSLTTREMAGTVPYMAPEQIQGKPRPASDQYALGIVVYEWLTGERPFQGSALEVYGQHLHVLPRPLRDRVPALSPAIEQVVLRALAKEPDQRFEGVQAFATAFEDACSGKPLQQQFVQPSPLDQSSQSTFVRIPFDESSQSTFVKLPQTPLSDSTIASPPPTPVGGAAFNPTPPGPLSGSTIPSQSSSPGSGATTTPALPDQSTFVRIPSNQPNLPPFVPVLAPGQPLSNQPSPTSIVSYSPGQPPLSIAGPIPSQPAQTRRGISRRALLLGLFGFGSVVGGSVLAWLGVTRGFSLANGPTSTPVGTSGGEVGVVTSPAATPAPSPTPTPTPSPTATPTPSPTATPTPSPTPTPTPNTVPGVPAQLSPPDGSVFNNFPRTTTLTWQTVSGAATYAVEIDCFHCCQANKWCTDVGQTWQIVPNLTATSYTFNFVGAQPGRWRVWALNAAGQAGPKSGWWGFTYTV
jgi:serine/threonine protein kinase